jgi:hypothetical protein
MLRLLVVLCLVTTAVCTAAGLILGGRVETGLAGFAATAVGLLVTVLIVQRVLDVEQQRQRRIEEAPLRRTAQRRLRIALSPVLLALTPLHAASPTASLQSHFNDPAWFLEQSRKQLVGEPWFRVLESKRRTIDQLLASVGRLSTSLDRLLERSARILTPEQEATIEAFLVWHASAGFLGEIREDIGTFGAEIDELDPAAARVLAFLVGGGLGGSTADVASSSFTEIMDTSLTEFFTALFDHLRELVALHDALDPSAKLTFAAEWSRAIAQRRRPLAVIAYVESRFAVPETASAEGDAPADRSP